MSDKELLEHYKVIIDALKTCINAQNSLIKTLTQELSVQTIEIPSPQRMGHNSVNYVEELK